MPHSGKRAASNGGRVDPGRRYGLEEGLQIVKDCANAKFDESVDIAVRLGVNPRQADQMVRGTVALPHGTGKTVRVVVFAEGDAARAAEEAGADVVGSDDLVNKIFNENWTEFDRAIASRNLMPKVGRLGKVLGPRGLMPNPKSGTVVDASDIGRAVTEIKGGRIQFRVDKAGIIHAQIGKASMSAEALRDNMLALMGTLVRLKPSSAKGVYVRSVAISSTMGPGVRFDANEVVRVAGDR